MVKKNIHFDSWDTYEDLLVTDALRLSPEAFKLEDSFKQIWKNMFVDCDRYLKCSSDFSQAIWSKFTEFFYQELDTVQINWLCLSILVAQAKGESVVVPGRGTFPKKMLETLLAQKEKPNWDDLKKPRKVKLSDKTIAVDGMTIEALCIDSKKCHLLWKGSFKEIDVDNETDLSADFSEKTWNDFLNAIYQGQSELNDVDAFLLADQYALSSLKDIQQKKLLILIESLTIDLDSFAKVETLYNYIQPIEDSDVLKKAHEDYFKRVFVEGSIDTISKIYHRKEKGDTDLFPFMLEGLKDCLKSGEATTENILKFHDPFFHQLLPTDSLLYVTMIIEGAENINIIKSKDGIHKFFDTRDVFTSFLNSLDQTQLTAIIKPIISTSQNPYILLNQLIKPRGSINTSEEEKQANAIRGIAFPMLKDADAIQLMLLGGYHKMSFDQLAKVAQKYKSIEDAYLKVIVEKDLSSFLAILKTIQDKHNFWIRDLQNLNEEKITFKQIVDHLKVSEARTIGVINSIIDSDKILEQLQQEIYSAIATNLGISLEEVQTFKPSNHFDYFFERVLKRCYDKKTFMEFHQLVTQFSDTLVDDLILNSIDIRNMIQKRPLYAKLLAYKAWRLLESGQKEGLSALIKGFGLINDMKPSEDERLIYAENLALLCQAEDAGTILDSFQYDQTLGRVFLQTILKGRDLKKIQNAFGSFWRSWIIKESPVYPHGSSPFDRYGSGCSKELLSLIDSEDVLKAVWDAVPEKTLKSTICRFLIHSHEHHNFGNNIRYQIKTDADVTAKILGLLDDESESNTVQVNFKGKYLWVPKN